MRLEMKIEQPEIITTHNGSREANINAHVHLICDPDESVQNKLLLTPHRIDVYESGRTVKLFKFHTHSIRLLLGKPRDWSYNFDNDSYGIIVSRYIPISKHTSRLTFHLISECQVLDKTKMEEMADIAVFDIGSPTEGNRREGIL